MVNFSFLPPPDFDQPAPYEYVQPVSEPISGNPYVGRLAVGSECVVTELANICDFDDVIISAEDALVLPLMYRRALAPTSQNLEIVRNVASELRGSPILARSIETALTEPFIKQRGGQLTVCLMIEGEEEVRRLKYEHDQVIRRLPRGAISARLVRPTIRVMETRSEDRASTVMKKLSSLAVQGIQLASPDAYLAPTN